jgi:putative ABC transport system ATP-binding protein
MERSLCGFILRYSRREQLAIVPLVVLSMVVYFASLDLPKAIVNNAIQGRGFADFDSTAMFMEFSFVMPAFLGGAKVVLLEGFALERLPYLFALTLAFLGLIVVAGLLKFQINTMKGWLGERMLRRLRYALFDHILRFPLPHFRHVKAAEMATMIKDEVEPVGGFVGESLITPLFLGGQALTAMVFILYQHIYLGMVAFGMVLLQTVIIPKMRRRLLTLSLQRQVTARQLAGRIAECVDGVVEIHAHDTSNFERAEISARLGKMFKIRFELYQRKFLIKFLNNFLSQVTPFLFYLIGGYLAIKGRLDIGTLVAVIAAYKDLPSPIKELIDWDQQRLDTEIKYNQVIEQFMVDELAPPHMQEPIESPELPRQGEIRANNLSLMDESDAKLLDSVSFSLPMDARLAVVGGNGSGGGALAQVLARLVVPTGGNLEIGGVDIVRAPEAVTGRALAYVGASSYLFPVSVRENMLYGLRHQPVRAAQYPAGEARLRANDLKETRRAGNLAMDIGADWVDYQAAGVQGPEQMEARLLEVLKMVELEETIFEIGLRSQAQAHLSGELSEGILRAREAMRERMAQPGLQALVERFDVERYSRNATLAENLLFGTPVGKSLTTDQLAANPYMRQVMEETGLARDILVIGHKLAETMIELFSDLPPGHELFDQFSFVHYDDLPNVKNVLAHVAEQGLDRITDAERMVLTTMPFKMIPAKHRLGLIDEALEAKVLETRRLFMAGLPESMRGEVEFFDPARQMGASSLQDNILFGKIVYGQAQGASRIGALLREVLDQLGLRPLVVKIGLDFEVGTGGSRLALAERQKVAIARAVLKRPAVLVFDQASAVLDAASERRVVANVLAAHKSSAVVWVLGRTELASMFDRVLVMDHGKLAEQGEFERLKGSGGAFHKLLLAV